MKQKRTYIKSIEDSNQHSIAVRPDKPEKGLVNFSSLYGEVVSDMITRHWKDKAMGGLAMTATTVGSVNTTDRSRQHRFTANRNLAILSNCLAYKSATVETLNLIWQ